MPLFHSLAALHCSTALKKAMQDRNDERHCNNIINVLYKTLKSYITVYVILALQLCNTDKLQFIRFHRAT